MQKKVCSLWLRVRHEGGKQRYYPAVVANNGTVKPFYCFVGGEPQKFPAGIYYIRYRDSSGKRYFENVGNDVAYARTQQRMREHILAGELLGMVAVPVAAAKPPINRPPAPNRVEAATAHLSPGEASTGRLSVAKAFRDYITAKEILSADKSASGYAHSLGTFTATCDKTYMDEIGDEDLLRFIQWMQRKGLADRTISNRCAELSTFMRHFDFAGAIRKKLIPSYTEKIVSAYTEAEIKALFAACDPEELLLFQFFLGTGLREQEVEYAAWTDLNFADGVFKVTEKLDVGFKIKDKEEREVPLPTALLEALKKRYATLRHSRWIFPTKRGQPDGHMLRKLHEIAFRAGLNCGGCRNKRGLSCIESESCSRWGLHKWRKTFATFHHRAGVSLVDLQKWLGHSDLATTQAYLAGSDTRSAQTRAVVDQSFANVAA